MMSIIILPKQIMTLIMCECMMSFIFLLKIISYFSFHKTMMSIIILPIKILTRIVGHSIK